MWSLGPPQRAGAGVGPRRAAVGDRVRPEHARRGQPDPAGPQLRLARRRGHGRHQGGQFTNPLVTWSRRPRRRRAAPRSSAARCTSAALRGGCVWQVPLRRRAARHADARCSPGATAACAPSVARARRLAVGHDVQPRRPRSAAQRRRPDHPRRDLVSRTYRSRARPSCRPRPRRRARAPSRAPRPRATRRSRPPRRGPTKSSSASGPIGWPAPSVMHASTSVGRHAVSSAKRTASNRNGNSSRLTTKPGWSGTSTARFSSGAPSAWARSRVVGGGLAGNASSMSSIRGDRVEDVEADEALGPPAGRRRARDGQRRGRRSRAPRPERDGRRAARTARAWRRASRRSPRRRTSGRRGPPRCRS